MHYGLPAVAGLAAELWGTNVFHCPDCHGWEVQDQRLAVYGSGERAVHQALLLTSLSDDVAVFCDSPTAFSKEQERHSQPPASTSAPNTSNGSTNKPTASTSCCKSIPR